MSLSLSTIYEALKRNRDLGEFAALAHLDNRTLKIRLTDPDYLDVMNALFATFCVRKYCKEKVKARPRGAWVANRGRSGEIKRLDGMFASERAFWEGGHGD